MLIIVSIEPTSIMKKCTLTVLTFLLFFSCNKDEDPRPENPADSPYEVIIDPNDFVGTDITGNDFLPLVAMKTYTYEGTNEDNEKVKVEEAYLEETKVVMGVTCRVVHAREWVNDELVEDTFDWYAQDKQGNVWYFGEDTKELEGGQVVSTGGSWEAGVDGALPGVIMPANLIPGMWYRQEYYQGEAEDVGQILGLNKSVTVAFGTFDNCLLTAEWSLLEPGIVEHKYYAPGVGLVKVEVVKGETGHEELVSIK